MVAPIAREDGDLVDAPRRHDGAPRNERGGRQDVGGAHAETVGREPNVRLFFGGGMGLGFGF